MAKVSDSGNYEVVEEDYKTGSALSIHGVVLNLMDRMNALSIHDKLEYIDKADKLYSMIAGFDSEGEDSLKQQLIDLEKKENKRLGGLKLGVREIELKDLNRLYGMAKQKATLCNIFIVTNKLNNDESIID